MNQDFSIKKQAPEIRTESLEKNFGTNKVLSGINITFHAGKTTAVLGPSGTGKSVLLKLVTGLLEPDAGSVYFDKTNFTKADNQTRSTICRSIGMLFQSAALFDSLTLIENVEFPLSYSNTSRSRKEITESAENYLGMVGLSEYAHSLPGEVSIGMRKRAGIARAMVTEPTVLLFDEPNTGLDPKVGQEIYDLINSLRRTSSFTGILVSHEIPEVFQCCDQVIMLYGGLVHFSGTVDEFRKSGNELVHQFSEGLTEGPISVQGM
ncbi:MAG TPA: ATP-binding cassette domain-containing protein [Oligoflexia bacterium]|nr:ATP-binding cassette domain-containing protein [Oligoflexia bacterium]HMP49248.1 ATP-binding cassette domain-containing protein [Oligoflexia bacterium]